MRKYTQPFVDWLQKKHREWKYKDGVYFKISSVEVEGGILPIELLKGRYSGTIYSYGAVNILEDIPDDDGGGAKASFDIIVEKYGKNLTENFSNDPKFIKEVGDIFLVVLEIALKTQADKYFNENLIDEENRENYTEEFIPRRTVRSKNSSVPKKRVSSGKSGKNPVRRNSKVRSKVQPPSDS